VLAFLGFRHLEPHFRKKRLKISKNVFCKIVLEFFFRSKSTCRFSNFELFWKIGSPYLTVTLRGGRNNLWNIDKISRWKISLLGHSIPSQPHFEKIGRHHLRFWKDFAYLLRLMSNYHNQNFLLPWPLWPEILTLKVFDLEANIKK
jgi:hypothetical protein